MQQHDYDGGYRRFIENMDQLPALPAIVSRLITVVNSAETSAEDAAELIEKDPALTSKVLRLSNSAFYGIPRGVSSVQSAVVILGFNTLKSLVLSASVMNLFPSQQSTGAFDRIRFWKHSIVCALAAKHIAHNLLNTLYIDPQSAFCAGIMHDIGKLLFELFTPKEYADVCRRSKSGAVPLSEAETLAFGLNHADIGRILADKWALPLDLEYTIVYHHDVTSAKKITELVSLVHLADHFAHRFDCGIWDGEACLPLSPEVGKYLSIDDSRYQRIMKTLPDEIEKHSEFFAIMGG